MTLDKDRFREQFAEAAQQRKPVGPADLRIIAWFEKGGLNFDMRTQDCSAPHLLTAAQTLADAGHSMRTSSAISSHEAKGEAREVALSQEETLRVDADDVLLLLEREKGRWTLDSHSCGKPAAEHLAWVAYVLERLVEVQALGLVQQAQRSAQQRVVESRV